VLADGAFVSIPDALWCEQQGITVYAPVGKATGGDSGSAAGKKGRGETKLPKGAFRYDGSEGGDHCPPGKRLEAGSRTAPGRRGRGAAGGGAQGQGGGLRGVPQGARVHQRQARADGEAVSGGGGTGADRGADGTAGGQAGVRAEVPKRGAGLRGPQRTQGAA